MLKILIFIFETFFKLILIKLKLNFSYQYFPFTPKQIHTRAHTHTHIYIHFDNIEKLSYAPDLNCLLEGSQTFNFSYRS